MADSTESSVDFSFKSIELIQESSLGTGAYGTVCKAQCDDLVCAAKVLHLLAFQNKDEKFMRLFERECKFLSAIHHPNITQYLGTWRDTATNLPVLLMELMDQSLTQFLENSQTLSLVPFHTQVNICHDIAMALSFLHSNGIIHRDLSSNNILMIGDRRAKVTDFGMAKLLEANQRSLSKRPGCDAYMPPEAYSESYSEKLDCFSFGVVIIQILTYQFPQPGNQFKIVHINDPSFPNGIEARASEAERRKNHIDLISADDPLLLVALECIKDKEDDRPSSRDLCKALASMKEKDQYANSVTKYSTDRLMDDIEKQVMDIQKLTLLSNDTGNENASKPDKDSASLLQDGIDQPAESQVEALQLKIKDMQSKELAVNEELEKLKAELNNTSEQLKQKESEVQANSEFKKKVKELERRLTASKQAVISLAEDAGPMELKKITLTWKKEFRAPRAISRTSEAVATTEMVVYMRPAGSKEIHVYNLDTLEWSYLPDSPINECSLAIIHRKITLIGGRNGSQFTSKLLSLVKTAGKMEWVVIYPAMTTKRCSTIVIHSHNSLIVAGGEGESGFLNTVEVLNTDTQVWQMVADLPEPLVFASATHIGSQLYILGGWVEKMTPTYLVLSASLQLLLQSSPSLNATSEEKESLTSPWQKLTKLPLKGSTCVSVRGRLLSIGGRDIHKPTSAIHIYNPLTDSWEILTHLNHSRHQCYAAALDEKLVVFGGWRLNSKQVLSETDLVEVATIT